MEFRVAPILASFGTSGAQASRPCFPVAPPDEVASCPASCILRPCRRPSFELPRLSRPSAHSVAMFRLPLTSLVRLRLSMRPPSCPGFCTFRPCRRWIFELPRISHPSAHPALKLWVAPQLCTSDCACRRVPRVAPASASSGCAGDGSSGCPASRVLRCLWRWCFGFPRGIALQLRLPVGLRVAPLSAPSGFALGLSFQVAPNSLSLGAG
jgi:hypothetical protein